MAISFAFSVVIFKSITFELERARERQEKRILIRPYEQPPQFIFEDDIFGEISTRVRNTLFLINLAILVGAGGLGYYLAGKSLAPIKEMLEAQERFVSDASHELKTPLTAMRLGLEVQLREKNIDAKSTSVVLKENLDEVIKLQKLTEGLLELSKVPSKQALAPILLSDLIDSATIDVAPLAAAKAIELRVVSPKHIIIKANKMKLQRSLVAIIENAIKYSPTNSSVKINTIRKTKTIEIVVRDYGLGIEAKDLPHLTDRFYRGDKSRSSQGYGLGLSIAKETLFEHGGTLEIVSQGSGKGTKVILAIPFSAKLQK